MNTLQIRNNAQILSIVSYSSVGLEYSTQNMLEFALEFDGLLIEDRSHVDSDTQYNYHPAIASNTICHPSWRVS